MATVAQVPDEQRWEHHHHDHDPAVITRGASANAEAAATPRLIRHPENRDLSGQKLEKAELKVKDDELTRLHGFQRLDTYVTHVFSCDGGAPRKGGGS